MPRDIGHLQPIMVEPVDLENARLDEFNDDGSAARSEARHEHACVGQNTVFK